MKKNKVKDSRPSFWINSTKSLMRVLYPDGYVEFFSDVDKRWYKSYYSGRNYKLSLSKLKSHHKFLGNG